MTGLSYFVLIGGLMIIAILDVCLQNPVSATLYWFPNGFVMFGYLQGYFRTDIYKRG